LVQNCYNIKTKYNSLQSAR